MFQNARELISIFGFKIKIHSSWIVIATLIVWTLSVSYFPSVLPASNQVELIVISIVATVGFFVSLILHELSHALVARRFGLNVGSITLFLFGGVAELERDPDSASSEFWIAIAGPAMSFFLCFMFYLLEGIWSDIFDSGSNAALFYYLGTINLVLALFNLVPAFPLDGGRILRSIIWKLKNDVLLATRVASRIGEFFGLFLIGSGIVVVFGIQSIAGLWQILIGLFIFSASRSSYGDLVVRQTLKNYSVSALMTRHPWVVSANDTVSTLVEDVMLRHNVSFVPVLDGDDLIGYVDSAMIKSIDQDNWSQTRIDDILVPVSDDNTTTAESRTEAVFDQMARTGNRKLLITRGKRLEGVISLSDLMAFLAIRSGLGLAPGESGFRHHGKTVDV